MYFYSKLKCASFHLTYSSTIKQHAARKQSKMILAPVDREYEKNKELTNKDVQVFMDWANKQPHLPKINELEAILFLHCTYYKQETSKQVLDAYFTIRTHCPEFFSKRVSNFALQKQMDVSVFKWLPASKLNSNRAIYARLIDTDVSKYVFSEQLKLFSMVVDMWLLTEGTSPGHVIINDMSGLSWSHVLKANVFLIKKYILYLQEAMPVRLKGIHLINVVPFVDKVLAIVKPFMKQELLDVLHVHSNGLESLYEFVPKECLPQDLGGNAPSIKDLHEQMKRDIIDNTDYFREEEKQRIDETKRPGKAKDAGQIFGVEGSFKKLDID